MSKIIALICPGQGSQYVGMAKDLIEQFANIRQVFEEASDAVHLNLLKLCLDGPDESLQLTTNAQPAILTVSYAWFKVLKQEKGLSPTVAAGHSLGEYSALVAAGVIKLGDAAKLVRLRGELMQSAVPVGKGKMAAILGLDDQLTIELCQKASKGTESIVVPANYNSPGQIVIAGHAGAVDRALALAADKESKFKAKAIPLKVSAPFHSPLMNPVAEKFAGSLEGVKWNELQFPVIANFDAKSHEKEELSRRLTSQIFSPVLWTKCVDALNTFGIDQFLEPGPGKVLCGLVKRCHKDSVTLSIDSFEDFKNLGELS